MTAAVTGSGPAGKGTAKAPGRRPRLCFHAVVTH